MIKAPNSDTRSKAYFGTVINDAAGRAEYDAVKKEARSFNALQRQMAKASGGRPLIKKVDCFGRLGQDNPNAHIYSCRNDLRQRINRAHAATLDIYVYEGYDQEIHHTLGNFTLFRAA